MGACDPNHEWRREPGQKETSYVRYRCTVCGSLCVAPDLVENGFLEVARAPVPRPTKGAERAPMEVPLWASVELPPSPPPG